MSKKRRRLPDEVGIALVVVLVVAIIAALSPTFRTLDNGKLLLLNGAVIAFLALRAVPGVEEAVILSTCNRTEFYLESMVIGETEIFGQVKKAYQAAATLGVTGKYPNRLFQKSFQVGKEVRANTGIGKGSSTGCTCTTWTRWKLWRPRGWKRVKGKRLWANNSSCGTYEISVNGWSAPRARGLRWPPE